MKKKLSVLFALVFVLALCASFAACKSGGNGPVKTKKLESGSVVAEGTFDSGVVLSVEKIEADDAKYAEVTAKVADKDYDREKVAVYDVSLIKGGAKTQPNGKVKITMPKPFDAEYGYATYHVKGETVEELVTTLSDDKISFETDGFSYFVIVGKIDESIPTYVRVDKNKNPDENGEYILFGSYPQTQVNAYDTSTLSALNGQAGENPSNGKNGKWTSYKYYYAKLLNDGTTESSNEIDFMWYIDVTYNGERYRGVYFDKYRPSAAKGTDNVLKDGKTEQVTCSQTKNRYYVENVYWFKYEPILWKIIQNKDGKAQLLCMTAVDCQPYTLLIKRDSTFLDDKERDDRYNLCYNVSPGVPEGTLGTDYEHSTVRDWLNGYFYEKAFNSAERSLVCDTEVDNVTGEVGKNTTDKLFIPSINEVKEIGGLDRKASDYAKSQGTEMQYGGTYCYSWYLRDAYYVLRFKDKKNLISYDRYRYYQLCSVNGGSAYASDNTPCFTGAEGSSNAVVPSLWLTL